MRVDGLNAIFGSGAFKTEPLKLLIARYIDEDLLHLVADQHRRGRRLFVVTTNIDAQRTALWNMGAIAASDYSERLQLFRDILVASASAPGLFAPTYIQVQAGNVRFQEMHVDGAVTSNVLAVPESVLLQKVAFRSTAKPKLYIIVNGKITPDFAVIGDGTLSIVARSFYSTVKANTRSTLIATYDFARRNGWQFRLAAIQPDYAMTSTTFNFDTDYMRGLFNLGFLRAAPASNGNRRCRPSPPALALSGSKRACRQRRSSRLQSEVGMICVDWVACVVLGAGFLGLTHPNWSGRKRPPWPYPSVPDWQWVSLACRPPLPPSALGARTPPSAWRLPQRSRSSSLPEWRSSGWLRSTPP